MEIFVLSILLFFLVIYGVFVYRTARYRSVAGARFGAVVRRNVGESRAQFDGVSVNMSVVALDSDAAEGARTGIEMRALTSGEPMGVITFSRDEANALVSLLQRTHPVEISP